MLALVQKGSAMEATIPQKELVIITVAVLVLLSVYCDLRWRKIPNSLTLPAIVLGFVLNFLGNSWSGLIFAFVGLLVGIGLLILPYLLGGMGGGDVKFLGALGALVGGYSTLNIFVYATLVGGAMALAVAIANRNLIATFKKMWLLLKCIVLFRAPEAGATLFEKSTSIPYGVAIGIGTVIFLVGGRII